MFTYFLITVWFEYDNKIHQKVLPKLYDNCEKTVIKIYEETKPPYKIKAVKCDTPKEFGDKRKDKRYGHAYKKIR
jgi:hypothetical protein